MTSQSAAVSGRWSATTARSPRALLALTPVAGLMTWLASQTRTSRATRRPSVQRRIWPWAAEWGREPGGRATRFALVRLCATSLVGVNDAASGQPLDRLELDGALAHARVVARDPGGVARRALLRVGVLHRRGKPQVE